MFYFFWRLSVALDIWERYGFTLGQAWRQSGRYRDEFKAGERSSSIVWGE